MTFATKPRAVALTTLPRNNCEIYQNPPPLTRWQFGKISSSFRQTARWGHRAMPHNGAIGSSRPTDCGATVGRHDLMPPPDAAEEASAKVASAIANNALSLVLFIVRFFLCESDTQCLADSCQATAARIVHRPAARHGQGTWSDKGDSSKPFPAANSSFVLSCGIQK